MLVLVRNHTDGRQPQREVPLYTVRYDQTYNDWRAVWDQDPQDPSRGWRPHVSATVPFVALAVAVVPSRVQFHEETYILLLEGRTVSIETTQFKITNVTEETDLEKVR